MKPIPTFTFTHPQNATPADDLTAAYQWSKDLQTFYPEGPGDGTTAPFSEMTRVKTRSGRTT